jgi:class 3 adenylate cyclase
VNTASRLESAVARPMTVVVGENTYNAVKDQFDCRTASATQTLKGKEKEVRGVSGAGRCGRAEVHGPRPVGGGTL